jgi:hypothetical protein
MKKTFYIMLVPVMLLMATSCKKTFSDLAQNNNQSTKVPPSLLLNGVLYSLYDAPGGSSEIDCQYYLYNYDYYGNNRYDFGSASMYYGTLENVVRMEQEALNAGAAAVNPYNALGKFFRAYFFTKMSLQLGDIPMTDALKGINNLTPSYDSQKKVFLQSLAWLDSANTSLATLIAKGDNTLSGDFYFNNDLKKWQKVVNTLKLRLLIDLSKKTSDADLNVSQQFANIYNNPAKYPIMQDATDNLQFVYITPTNFYPDNANNFGNNGSRKNMSATHIGLLTQLNDPRVFVVAEPSRYLVDSLSQSPTSYQSFVGADPGLDLGVMYNNAGLQRYSFLNRKRYYSGYTAENCIQLGYPELCFNIAEAINRGWITGNAETYYVAGIKASMAFYGIPLSGTFNAYYYRPGSTDVTNSQNYDTYSVNFDWNTYYTKSAVGYAGNNAAGLTQILQQKYLALFRHSGLESYYTYRRTGVPTFTTGPGTGNSGRIAMRYQYPKSELTSNLTNYSAALKSQYTGNDDINGLMWILQ